MIPFKKMEVSLKYPKSHQLQKQFVNKIFLLTKNK